MSKPQDVLRSSYETILIKSINEKGGKATDAADIWLNLQYLTVSCMSYGEEKLILPLQIKKILAYILDPDYHIEFEVAKTEKDCTVTALFFWGNSDSPAGRGFVKRYINQIFPNESKSYEERESVFESTVRGLAASRAITDAGIGMQFYADSLDIPDPELTDINGKGVSKPEVPDIPSNNQKKQAIVQQNNKEKNRLSANANKKQIHPETADDSDSNTDLPGISSKNPVKEGAKTESTAVENDTVDLSDMFSSTLVTEFPAQQEKEATDLPTPEQIEWARNTIIDCGKFRGLSLGEVLDHNKITGIIWLARNAEADVAKAANILIKSDLRFKEFSNI